MNVQKIIIYLVLVLSSLSFGQSVTGYKKKNSTTHGTLFAMWGYNRSWYTQSNIRFKGSDYDFKLKNAKASDRPSDFSFSYYFNPNTLTIPQYNTRIGYYFMDKWAFVVGWDHMKYVFNDKNEVLLDGFVTPGSDANWSGDYDNQPIVTNRDDFHYENTNGYNLIRFELMKSWDLWSVGSKKQFAITGHSGLAVGPALTFSDLNFQQKHTIGTPSLSGFGMALGGSIRTEFFRHFFMQIDMNLGVAALTRVRTRPDDRNQFARHTFGYSQYFVAAGWLFYLNPKNKCDSCPNW
jgi:hypothetical protein